ncbi:unnamed protein product [Brassica rapa subsp. trilocularis]
MLSVMNYPNCDVCLVSPKKRRLFLNGTFGTDIYFDTETDAEKEHYAKWLKPDSLFIKTDSCSEDRPLTVSELNQSVLTADPQIIEFLCTAKVIQSEKGGVILAAVDVLRRLYHVELSAADQTDDALFGDQHEQVQNPIASMVPAGNSSTVVEIVDNLAAKLGETTDVNHQTPSSTVPEGGRPASSTPPVDRYESEKKKLRLA